MAWMTVREKGYEQMKVSFCSRRKIVHPSNLPDIKYEIGPYYGCEHHCLYCYTLNNAESDWSNEILVNEGMEQQLEMELSALERGTVLVGRDTDPYQPVEAEVQHTCKALQVLARLGFPACILTKSDMVVRDLDLLAKMPGSSVGFSLSFHDEDMRRLFEVSAPPNERRIEALKRARDAGIETYVLISPVFPYLTDVDALIEAIRGYADTIWIYRIKFNSESDPDWVSMSEVLEKHFPRLRERLKEVAFSPGHNYWAELRRRLQTMQIDQGLNLRIEL